MWAKWPVFITSGLVLLLPAGAAAQQVGRQVRVAVQNELAPPQLLGQAQSQVTRLFSLIDVDVIWVTEPLEETRGVRVVKITNWEPTDRGISTDALGITYSGDRGTRRAYVIWSRVQRRAIRSAVGVDTMLAIAIAHEVGHMLLPPGSHGKHGLMRETWDPNDLRLAAAGLLHFSPESAVRIAQGRRTGAPVAIR
jgi:hypothetical protein